MVCHGLTLVGVHIPCERPSRWSGLCEMHYWENQAQGMVERVDEERARGDAWRDRLAFLLIVWPDLQRLLDMVSCPNHQRILRSDLPLDCPNCGELM